MGQLNEHTPHCTQRLGSGRTHAVARVSYFSLSELNQCVVIPVPFPAVRPDRMRPQRAPPSIAQGRSPGRHGVAAASGRPRRRGPDAVRPRGRRDEARRRWVGRSHYSEPTKKVRAADEQEEGQEEGQEEQEEGQEGQEEVARLFVRGAGRAGRKPLPAGASSRTQRIVCSARRAHRRARRARRPPYASPHRPCAHATGRGSGVGLLYSRIAAGYPFSRERRARAQDV